MKPLILIKLGGSLITDKSYPYTAAPTVIRRLAQEIKRADSSDLNFIISHGSGSFGHTLASKYGTADGISTPDQIHGLCLVQQDAMAINRIVNKIFLEEGLDVLSFSPSSFTIADNRSLSGLFIDPILNAIKLNIIPLVFGDIILDRQNGSCIYSGETTLDNLLYRLHLYGYHITKVIQAGTTNGVYDELGHTIPKITSANIDRIKALLGKSAATDVTGGMLHKVEESLNMAKLGLDVIIINGQIPNSLYQSIASSDYSASTIVSI